MGEALPQIRDGEDGGEPPHQIGTEISRNLARVKANGRGPPDAHDVHAFNQRSVEGIPDMIRTIGAMVEARERAEQLVATLEAGPDADRRGARRREQPGSSERASVARGGAGIRWPHPCPSTGRANGACSGYVRDHVVPLSCGGPDAVENMQCQTVAGPADGPVLLLLHGFPTPSSPTA